MASAKQRNRYPPLTRLRWPAPLRVMLLVLVWLVTSSVCAETLVDDQDMVVIVNPHNPTPKVTPLQIKQLFLGRLRLFPDTTIPVQIVDLPHDSANFVRFYQEFTGMDVARLSRHRSRYFFTGQGRLPDSVQDVTELLAWVASNPGAIGYIRRDQWQDTVRIIYP